MDLGTYFLIALAVFVTINILSFGVYRNDKMKARRNQWRTSEAALLVWALFGPYGAYLAMKRYRHKTRQAKFLLVPIFLIVETGAITFLALRYFSIPFL